MSGDETERQAEERDGAGREGGGRGTFAKSSFESVYRVGVEVGEAGGE